jgi:hypothetical protein
MTAIPALQSLLSTAPAPRGAEVLSREGDVLRLGCGTEARAALSCLVVPEPGDLVLVTEAGGAAYVLAVLERRQAHPLRLLAAGDVEIGATGGRLRLQGGAGVEIATPGRFSAAAEEVALAGRSARFTFAEAAGSVQRMTAEFGVVKLVADALERVVGRLLTRARNSYRFVEEGEHLRAGTIDHAAQGTLHVRAEHAVIKAGSIVKVDGGQIQLG